MSHFVNRIIFSSRKQDPMGLFAALINGGGSLWRWCPGCLRGQQYIRVNAGTIRCLACGRQTIG